VLTVALACGLFAPPDLNRVIAIEITTPDSLEEFDTLRPHARELNGHNDSVATTFVWGTLDTAALTVLDSATGLTVVNHSGQTGRLVARSPDFVSNPIFIRTLAAADTVFTTRTTPDTVTLPDSLSDSLTVEIADTSAASGGGSLTVALAGRPVVFAIAYPVSAGSVTLVTSDTARALVTTDTVASSTVGVAGIRVRLIAAPTPDSVVVTASAHRAVDTAVPGSPVTFVVRFQP
jgi:hypothetical protein